MGRNPSRRRLRQLVSQINWQKPWSPSKLLAGADEEAELTVAAAALHHDAAHPVAIGYFNFEPETFAPTGGRQSDLSQLAACGARVIIASIGFGCYFQVGEEERHTAREPSPEDAEGRRPRYELAGSDEWLLANQLKRIDWAVSIIDACPGAKLVRSAADLDLSGSEQVAVLLHLTGNNHTLSVDIIDEFYRRGVRIIHPAMQYHSKTCSGLGGMEAPSPLTALGVACVRRMGELGMIVDTAHASDETAAALIAAAAPAAVIDSHTTSRTRVPRSRGHTDSNLLRLAQSGTQAHVLNSSRHHVSVTTMLPHESNQGSLRALAVCAQAVWLVSTSRTTWSRMMSGLADAMDRPQLRRSMQTGHTTGGVWRKRQTRMNG